MFKGDGATLALPIIALFLFGAGARIEETSSIVRRFEIVGDASRGSSLRPESKSFVVVVCRMHSNKRLQNVWQLLFATL